MSKFKKLLAGMLTGVSALACVAMVGNELGYKEISAMTVSNNNTVASWSTDDMDGLLLGSSTTYSECTFKQTSTLNINSHILLIPVPSGAAGTLAVVGTGNNTSRYITLMMSNGSMSTDGSDKIDMKKTEQTLSFDSTNIITTDGKCYIGVNPEKTDYKIKTLKVTLTTGAYAQQYSVNYYDGSTILKTISVTGGEVSSYEATKWGYDLVGYYSDDALLESYDNSSVISADTNVYTKWTAWDEEIFGDGNVLNPTLMKKGLDTFGNAAFNNDVKLTGTNYSVVNGGTAFTSVSDEIDGLGTVNAAIKTGGKMTSDNLKNGLKLSVSTAGTLYAYIKSAASTNYNLEAFGPTNLSSEIAASNDGVSLVSIDIATAGDYYIGAAGTIYIYSISFVESPAVEVAKLNAQFDNDVEKNAVRFIGTIVAEDLTKVTDIKITLTLSGNDTPAVVDFTTVYTSVSHLTGFGEAENTYYIILKITNLAAYRSSTLNATLSFMIDGVEHSASLAEALSLAV